MSKTQVAVAIAALLTAFAVGRYSLPEKIKIVTNTVEVEKKTEKKTVEADKHKTTTTKEVVKPDGTKETTTTVVEDTTRNSNTDSTTDKNKSAQSDSETTYGSSKVTVSALAGAKLGFPPTEGTLVYGGSITKPILGPITVGIWALSNATGGASIGLTF